MRHNCENCHYFGRTGRGRGICRLLQGEVGDKDRCLGWESAAVAPLRSSDGQTVIVEGYDGTKKSAL